MLFSLLVIASMSSPVLEQPLATHVREMTIRMLISDSDTEESAIDKEVHDIYAMRGFLTTSEVGDEASYDFVFLLMSQPHSVQQ